jgi:rhombotail lipoprotein
VLRLPLRVGIAFVPGVSDISEQQKTLLLTRVAAEFKGLDYIQSIEIVPSTYLRTGGGFENLN